jgi:hypothetical protein
MATSILKLTAADVAAKINPLSHAGYFTIGSQAGQVPTDIVDSALAEQEAIALSSIPEKYRKITNHFDGLILLRFAVGGETTLTCPVAPTAGTILLFRNFPGPFGRGMTQFYGQPGTNYYISAAVSTADRQIPYSERNADDAMTETTDWTLDEDGVTINLVTAATRGDHYIADYDHDGMGDCQELRGVVLTLTAVEMLRRFPNLSENISDKISGWSTDAQLYLRRMWGGSEYKTGIQFFDRLDLVAEFETRMTGGTKRWGQGGMLL